MQIKQDNGHLMKGLFVLFLLFTLPLQAQYLTQKPPLGVQVDWSHPPSKDLIGIWLFNEGSGNLLYDISGNGGTGVLTNMEGGDWIPGRNGYALDFDGSNEYVNIANSNHFETQQGTIVVWFKANTIGGNAVEPIVATNGSARWLIYVYNSDLRIYTSVTGSYGKADISIANDVLYQIALTSDGVDWTFYVDGQEKGFTVLGGTNDGTWLGDLDVYDIQLGGETAQTNYFDCYIYDVQIYDRCLILEEINSLYMFPYQHIQMNPIIAKRLFPSVAPSGRTRGGKLASVSYIPRYNPRLRVWDKFFIWRGDTLLLVGDCVTQGPSWTGANFNYTNYIDSVAALGLNAIHYWSYVGIDDASQLADARVGYDGPEEMPYSGDADGNAYDVTAWNSGYWSRITAAASHAKDKGLVFMYTLHDGFHKGATRFGDHPFNSSRGNGPNDTDDDYTELADWTVDYSDTSTARYSSLSTTAKNQAAQDWFTKKAVYELDNYSNIIIEAFNEGGTDVFPAAERTSAEEHTLDVLKARNTLIPIASNSVRLNDTPNFVVNLDERNHSQIDIIAVHGVYKNQVQALVDSSNATPIKPMWLSEQIAEFDGGIDGGEWRMDSVSVYVWLHTTALWHVTLQNDISFMFDPNTALNTSTYRARWDSALTIVGYCAKFWNQRDATYGKPQFTDMAAASSGFGGATIMCYDAGDEYVIYDIAGDGGTVDLTAESGTWDVILFNPRTGVYSSGGTLSGGANRTINDPSFDDDAVYWVRKQ